MEKMGSLGQEKLIEENLEMGILEREQIEKEELKNAEREKPEWKKEVMQVESTTQRVDDATGINVFTEQGESNHPPGYIASVCKRPGLSCMNVYVLVECSPYLVPVRAWNCASFFSQSSTLMATCDAEKDSCVATVDSGHIPPDEEMDGLEKPLCRRPGAQCADSATLIHCSNDLHSATIAVCADVFPEADNSAVCDYNLDACVVRVREGMEGSSEEETIHATSTTDRPPETTPAIAVTFPTPPIRSEASTPSSNEKFPGKPYPSDDPSDTILALFPTLRNRCIRPGLRCSGGRILEACEKDKPMPVYRMDCSVVMADFVDARCEEQNSGEATCIISMRRNPPLLKQTSYGSAPKEEIYTLELSVVDVTKSTESYESDIPPWECLKTGQYCGDESTLLSCNADFTLEFALSCGAIAPDSVVAFCDSDRDACVVKKISDFTPGENAPSIPNGGSDKTDVDIREPGRPNSEHPLLPFPLKHNATSGNSEDGPVFQPATSEWDFATISQLYPPDIPLGAYGSTPLVNPFKTAEGSTLASTSNKCIKKGPFCLDDLHLGSCSETLELQYVLPCSALYTTDSAPFCDRKLSACLPSYSRKQSVTKLAPNTTTMKYPMTTTTESTTLIELSHSNPFSQEHVSLYPVHDYPQPSIGLPLTLARPPIHGSPLTNPNNGQSSLTSDKYYPRPFLAPEAYTFFQRPNIRYPQQPSRLTHFLQSIYGVLNSPQTFRPQLPLLNNIMQIFSTSKPPSTHLQNTEYGEYQQEPYDYNVPPYEYANMFPSNYMPAAYHAVTPISQWLGEGDRPQVVGVRPNLYRDILRHYANLIKPNKLEGTHGLPNTLGKKEQSTQRPMQLYFDHFPEKLTDQTPVQEPPSKLNPGPFKTTGDSLVYGMLRPTGESIASTEVKLSSDFQGSVSQVNPLAWLDRVEILEGKNPAVCRRPGMQCIDSMSLGACSRDLQLRYVIPCRNLLPFVSMGKPHCSYGNDACGLLVEEVKSEYPTDYTSYP